MSPNKCFASPPPNLDLSQLTGLLVVVEGPDSSGRSTHIKLLTQWLEERGYAVVQAGIKRSTLVSKELDQAKKGNVLSPRTMSLFYAADFYDQMENVIAPALYSGSIVLADRYVFTLMARDIVRGAETEWVESVYSRAVIPDATFFLKAPPQTLVSRALERNSRLDYWESGIDMALSRDWFDCFIEYQERIDAVFKRLAKRYGFDSINADRAKDAIQKDLQSHMKKLLSKLDKRVSSFE